MDTLQYCLNELRMMSTNMMSRKQRTGSSCIYRDELDKKKSQKRGSTPEEQPLLQKIIYRSAEKEEEEADRGFKLKVLMTKEEAARLLSKFKDGRRLDLKDLADELTLIQAFPPAIVGFRL